MTNQIQIDIINESSLPDSVIQSWMAALQAQIEQDFKPAWGFGADLHFVPKGGKPTPGHWWLGVFDNSDQAGALGYHDLTSEGLPFGKVFQATDKQYGEDSVVTSSHELLEMLVDPYINLVAMFQSSNTAGTLVAYEVGDPTQGDTYVKNGLHVSNFVLPPYFEPGPHAPGTKYDFLGLVTGTFPAIRPGGYYSYFHISRSSGWKQKMAQTAPAHKSRPAKGSRRELRGVDVDERRKSSAHAHP